MAKLNLGLRFYLSPKATDFTAHWVGCGLSEQILQVPLSCSFIKSREHYMRTTFFVWKAKQGNDTILDIRPRIEHKKRKVAEKKIEKVKDWWIGFCADCEHNCGK